MNLSTLALRLANRSPSCHQSETLPQQYTHKHSAQDKENYLSQLRVMHNLKISSLPIPRLQPTSLPQLLRATLNQTCVSTLERSSGGSSLHEPFRPLPRTFAEMKGSTYRRSEPPNSYLFISFRLVHALYITNT